jgi:hypothetical protein
MCVEFLRNASQVSFVPDLDLFKIDGKILNILYLFAKYSTFYIFYNTFLKAARLQMSQNISRISVLRKMF